jgi:redox-sensitive bicupin YhaK (pirin superfamily)
VSNLERRPVETATGGLATVSQEPTRRLLRHRDVPLGGPRGMTVRRTLPHRELPTVGSVGSQQVVRPGSLSLMTAGRGIAHAETSTPTSPVLRGVQLWVALPDAHRDTAPAFEHHPELPVHADGGLTATVVLGPLGDVASPATTFTPIVGADLTVRAGTSGTVPLEPGWEHAVLPLTDGVAIDGEPVPAATLAYLGCGRDRLRVSAGPREARALLLGGAPLDEELLMWWNFVGRTHEEVVAAREEWMAAVDGATTRFGRVASYDGPPLPAPTLPGTRLRPRSRRS